MSKIVILAISMAVLAGVGNYLFAYKLEQQTTGGDKVAVMVASRDLNRGEILKTDDFAERQIPIAYVDERDVTGNRKKELKGAPIQVAVKKGQVLQWTDFQARMADGKNDLADLVEPGKRAMTIVVNRESAFGGLLKPGHRVDIIGTFANSGYAGGGSKQRSQVLLQNVRVLATGNQLSSEDAGSGFNTVTLSVSVEQGELLSFAGNLGELSLVMRGYSDVSVTEGIPTKGYDDIFGERKPLLSKADKNQNNPIERLQVKK
ncbi:MAG: Flp pilus assembly protein CpaB [Deltaproteobacteria bacterium]|nr:Flp pilus assembly protein CpaB [Deltaproteobacteria bacterium]